MKYVTELPPSGRGKYARQGTKEHQEILSALKARPTEWMEVKECLNNGAANTWAYRARHGQYLAFQGEPVEATVRGQKVFMRWMP